MHKKKKSEQLEITFYTFFKNSVRNDHWGHLWKTLSFSMMVKISWAVCSMHFRLTDVTFFQVSHHHDQSVSRLLPSHICNYCKISQSFKLKHMESGLRHSQRAFYVVRYKTYGTCFWKVDVGFHGSSTQAAWSHRCSLFLPHATFTQCAERSEACWVYLFLWELGDVVHSSIGLNFGIEMVDNGPKKQKQKTHFEMLHLHFLSNFQW